MDANRRWGRVKGPMSAVIVQLLDLGWTPSLPYSWADPSGDEWILAKNVCGWGEPTARTQQDVEIAVWAKAAAFENGQGSEQ
eukprot:2934232-Alexandrium_andersonii.AAC.1